jgi:hypothetical protein
MILLARHLSAYMRRPTSQLAKRMPYRNHQVGGSMNIDSEIKHFSDFSPLDQARFMTRFMYELTLEGRNFYGPGGEQPIDANKLRFINEIQHRVTRFIEQILIDDPARTSNDVMLRLLLAPRSEKAIESLIQSAYVRTVQALS